MKLHEVIKKIADEHGIGIVCQENLVNFVSDYSSDAFQPPSLRVILKYVISKGYAQQLVNCPSREINQMLCHLCSKIATEAGYSAQYTNYVLNCIAYGYGFNITFEEQHEIRYRQPNIPKVLEQPCQSIERQKNSTGARRASCNQSPYYGHLVFKGVEICGYAEDFVDKMCANGFSIIKEECDDSNYVLKGSYSRLDCKLMVQISPKTRCTCKIMVIFDDESYKNWRALKYLYFHLKDKLTQKYGKPFSEVEAFFPPYKDGDGNEIQLLDDCLGSYQSKYNAEGGEVRLLIINKARIAIAFMDTLGCAQLDREFREAEFNDM